MFKRHGAERSGKDTVTTVSGRCKEADPRRRRTADEVSKRLVVLQKIRFPRPKRLTVVDSCLLATGRPALRRQVPIASGITQAFIRNPEWSGQAVRGFLSDVLLCSNKSSRKNTNVTKVAVGHYCYPILSEGQEKR